MEICLLMRFESQLRTNPNQFGYKKGVGTEMAVYCLKQVVHQYVRKDTPIYACYLDASRAFDLVNHSLLLKKLCDMGFPQQSLNSFSFGFALKLLKLNGVLTHRSPFRFRILLGKEGFSAPICLQSTWMIYQSS